MDDALRPRRRARACAARVRAAAAAGRARRARSSARSRPAGTWSPRRARASGRASPTWCRRSSRGCASSSRRRRRRCRSSCCATTCRSPPRRSAARSRSPSSRAARTTSAAASCTASSRRCCRTAATAAPGRRCRAGSTRPRPATAPSSSVEPSDALWAELAVGGDRCAGRRCPFVSTCFAEAARDRAGEADLVIANHALYFAHLAAGGGVLPEHDAVVFDEAHRLEESAASWLGGRVSRAGLRRLALDVERACRDGQKPLPGAGARPRRACRRAAAARRRTRRPGAAACATSRPRRRSS